MKILFITERYPYPLDSGGKIVSYQILKMLSKTHTVHLIVPAESMPSKKQLNALRQLGIKITIVISKKSSPWYKQSPIEIASDIIHLNIQAFSSFTDKAFRDAIDILLAKNHYDIIHVDHLSMAQYFPKVKKTKWILLEHNIEHKLYLDFYRVSPFCSKEQFLHLYNAITLSIYERFMCNRVDQIIVLSQLDRRNLIQMGICAKKILVIFPYAKHLNKGDIPKKNSDGLLFIGNLWWKPNLDAMHWFLQKIFPIVQRYSKRVSLTIVGEGAHLLSSYKSNQITILENRPNIQPYLKRAKIFILPFRIGQGVRIKALTAIVNDIPIISTSVGMRGLLAQKGNHYIEANSPEQFAQQIGILIHNKKNQSDISRKAVEYIKEIHNQNVISKQIYNYGKLVG